MATIKITKADLIGNIENFPIEIVEKMIEEQVRQGNKASVKVFQKYKVADRHQGGFRWDNTKEESIFWHRVIVGEDFDMFFKKYPKVDSKVYIIGDSKIGIDIIKTLEKYGGVNKYELEGKDDGVIYYIDPMTNFITLTDIDSETYNVVAATFKCIKAEEHKIVVSLQNIAEILGVDANRIVIEA
jgi:hypothetical protein